MKHSLKFIVLGILAVSSCSKLSPDLSISQDNRKQLIVDAFWEDSVVKTQISDKDSTKVLWSPRDSFTMFFQDRHAIFRSDSVTSTSKSRFKGYIEIATAESDTLTALDLLYGIYPHKSSNKADNGQFFFDIDSVQRAVPGSFDPMAYPSIARSPKLNLAFYNVCGGMAFTLKNEGIRTIIFSTNGKAHIAGRVTANFDENGEPKIIEFNHPADSIVLKAPDGGTFIPGVKYYLSMAPGQLDEGFTVTFLKKSIKATYFHKTGVTVRRSCFGFIDSIDKDLEFILNVDTIILDRHHINIDMDSTTRLNVTVLPEDASDKKIIWSSGNKAVAIVDSTGLVTPIAPGQAKIYAKSKSNPDARDSCLVDVFQTINLSEKGTANCYLVSQPGKYKIKASVKGISGTSLGIPSSAERLWQFKTVDRNLITNPVIIIDNIKLSGDGKWLIFDVPKSIEEGSAVVAVKNKQGQILWSWHIWVAIGYDPEATAHVYNNGAGTVMSRNLGSGYASGPSYQSPGMYYQWGRKDPFPGYYGIPIEYIVGNLSWPDPVMSDKTTGTIEYTVANPMTYLKTTGSDFYYDWYYLASGTQMDTTRWRSIKTDYDPCPLGWKVPQGGVDGLWAIASGQTKQMTKSGIWEYENKGMYLEEVLGTKEKCWYGSTGCFFSSDGTISSPRIIGYYWSCTYNLSQKRVYCFHINRNDEIYPIYNGKGAEAMAIRCVKEQPTK